MNRAPYGHDCYDLIRDLDVILDVSRNVGVIQKAIADLGFRRDSAGNLEVDNPAEAKATLERIDRK